MNLIQYTLLIAIGQVGEILEQLVRGVLGLAVKLKDSRVKVETARINLLEKKWHLFNLLEMKTSRTAGV